MVEEQAQRRAAPRLPRQMTPVARAVAVSAATAALMLLPATAVQAAQAGQTAQAARAAKATKAPNALTSARKAAAAPATKAGVRPVGLSAKTAAPAAPRPPSANKNIAVALAAVPTRSLALLSAGCLDGRHGEWLSGELGAAGAGLSAGSIRPAAAPAAPTPQRSGDDGPGPRSEGAAAPGDTIGALDAMGAAGASDASGASGATGTGCVPFASVRTPADRIESLALMPAAGEPQRVMVVSRIDLASAATTRWHDFAGAPGDQRELWLQAAALLGGEVAEQVPQRWHRDVSVLVRQMKRLTQAADTVWVRLVLAGEGEAARVDAVELVDDASGQALDSAIWLDRADGPGGFVSAIGGDHERVLWQSPVDYRRISRGVGAATVVVRKRVLAKPKTPGGKPRVVVRSYRMHGQHQGIDFAAPSGTPVATVADGTVVHAGRSGGYGNLVVVDHGGGITTYYAHLSAFAAGLQEGVRVERGQEIGQVGSTGRSTGPHLHYEIRRDGQYLDPANPAHSLPNWSLAADEHHAVLTRLLALSLSRQGAQARATRQPALAAAPAASAAAGTVAAE